MKKIVVLLLAIGLYLGFIGLLWVLRDSIEFLTVKVLIFVPLFLLLNTALFGLIFRREVRL